MRTTTPRAREVALVLAGLLVLGGCRDGAALFSAEDRLDRAAENPRRLTWNTADDRSPSWSADGDSVYYSAEVPGPLPRPLATLQAVPADGGTARPLLGAVQVESAARRMLVAPRPSPEGERLAYVELWGIRPRDMCIARGTPLIVLTCDTPPPVLAPILTEVRVRVRAHAETRPVEADPELALELHHFQEDVSRRPFGGNPVHIYWDHPFHQVHRHDAVRFFRASWAPDGERLVVSDGLRLLIWRPGGGALEVPGTEDGISAAWSPDGSWIAFTRLVRGDSIVNVCIQSFEGEPICQTEFHEYAIGRRELTLVRPDGSEARVLGEGDEPAWAPDGRTLYFRRVDRLWRVDIESGVAEEIPGTGSGREPAVSPDGRRLAFVREGGPGGRDVWVLELETP